MTNEQRLALRMDDRVTRRSNGKTYQVTRTGQWLGQFVVGVQVLNDKTGKPWQREWDISEANASGWAVAGQAHSQEQGL